MSRLSQAADYNLGQLEDFLWWHVLLQIVLVLQLHLSLVQLYPGIEMGLMPSDTLFWARWNSESLQ